MAKPNQEKLEKVQIAEHFLLNAQVGIPLDGKIQLNKDKEAVHSYFINEVNRKTVFFTTLEEKINYLLDEKYLDPEVFNTYTMDDIKAVYKRAHSYKHRFPSFMSAHKFYKQYALKTWDGKSYLGRYEDTMVWCALGFGQGNVQHALDQLDELMLGRSVPATPTLLNIARYNAGEKTSCFKAGTRITTINGTINIEDIKVGDEVLTHDGTFKKVTELKINTNSEPLVELDVVGVNGMLEGTPEHPVLALNSLTERDVPELVGKDGATGNVRWVALKDLRKGDHVVVGSTLPTEGATPEYLRVYQVNNHSCYQLHRVRGVKRTDVEPTVYNLEVEGNHTYVANNIVVHNCFLLSFQDNMNSIRRVKADGEALSALGGGVSFSLINLRESGAPVKGFEGRATSKVLIGKVLEDIASYANQGGKHLCYRTV